MGTWRDDRAGAVRVAVLGSGQMGTKVCQIVLDKEGLDLVAVVSKRPERAGADAGEILGTGARVGVLVTNDLDSTLAETSPHVVIQTTCSTAAAAEPELRVCIEHGCDVISIAEELSWPWTGSPEWADAIDALARRHGVTVLGTGVNPGFVLDLLVVALTGVCAEVRAITATRVNDLSPYGPTVLTTQGVGLTPEEFASGVSEGSVVGHVGFPESIAMIANALGWRIDAVDQTREPIIAKVRRVTPFVMVEPGMVAGCRHTATAYRDGRAVISLVHPQQVCPEVEGLATGDTIEIDGDPVVRLSGSPEIPGGLATAAIAVNMIPRVVAAAPGLTSMAALPVPAAIEGDVRTLIRTGGTDG
ncbi:MAG TPA: 2,4-diaminopentanoate dehydrogenase [Acidimicrobiales bacterium]